MADNVEITAGAGTPIATDQIGTVHYQRVKVSVGADGSATDATSANPLPVSQSKEGTVKTPLRQLLSANGDGTGTTNWIGDYSTPDIAYIQPSAGTVYRIERMFVTIQDGSGMRAERYGTLAGALGTGIQVRVQNDGGTVHDLTAGLLVTNNALWGAHCYDADLKAWGVGDDVLCVRWTFSKAGFPLRLDGDSNERLEVVLSDDLTGLVAHYFKVEGYEE